MPRYLITGATGLIGRALVDGWDSCDELVLCTRCEPARGKDRVTWLRVDLAAEGWRARLPGRVDGVVHLAQSARFREFPSGVDDVLAVNVTATQRLLDYALSAGAEKFVLASSGAARAGASLAGPGGLLPADLGSYAASKASAELLATAYQSRLAVKLLRFFFVYGPGQEPGMLMPRLCESIRHGRPVRLEGPAGLRLTPTFVTDAAVAVRAALDAPGSERFDVAGDEVLSLREVAETIGRALGSEPVFDVATDSRPVDFIADVRRFCELAPGPRVSLAEGITRLLVHDAEHREAALAAANRD